MTVKAKDISPYKHLIDTRQVTPDYLNELFELTDFVRKQDRFLRTLEHRIVIVAMWEPSTRTSVSFEVAAKRLGGECIVRENMGQFSSTVKGETLEDTIEILSGNCNILVFRHPADDACERALPHAAVPLVNAGSGTTQHPTQALLDAYTLRSKFGRLNDLKIAFVGDLLMGRTSRSLTYLLSKYTGNTLYFVSHKHSRIPDGLRDHLLEHKVRFFETEDFVDVLPIVDAVYMTRNQKERRHGIEIGDEHSKHELILTNVLADSMRPDSIIMHPLPRNEELPGDVDANPRAWWVKQAQNGPSIRMSVLTLLAQKRP